MTIQCIQRKGTNRLLDNPAFSMQRCKCVEIHRSGERTPSGPRRAQQEAVPTGPTKGASCPFFRHNVYSLFLQTLKVQVQTFPLYGRNTRLSETMILHNSPKNGSAVD